MCNIERSIMNIEHQEIKRALAVMYNGDGVSVWWFDPDGEIHFFDNIPQNYPRFAVGTFIDRHEARDRFIDMIDKEGWELQDDMDPEDVVTSILGKETEMPFDADLAIKELMGSIDQHADGELTEGLDETVHDIASGEASDVNNGGNARQVEYIVSKLGPDGVTQIENLLKGGA